LKPLASSIEMNKELSDFAKNIKFFDAKSTTEIQNILLDFYHGSVE